MIEIALEGLASGRGQTVFSLRRAAFERFRAADVTRVFQLARMHTQVAVARFYRGLQLVESHRLMRRERADNSQPQTLMNHAIDFARAMRRAAVHGVELLLLCCFFVRCALE